MTDRSSSQSLHLQHRIDDAHLGAPNPEISSHCQAGSQISTPARTAGHVPFGADDSGRDFNERRSAELEALLPHHAVDLIQKLQDWANSLDRREAELNARLALLEHNKRTSRLQSQNHAVARDEEERSLARRREALKNHLRQRALGSTFPRS